MLLGEAVNVLVMAEETTDAAASTAAAAADTAKDEDVEEETLDEMVSIAVEVMREMSVAEGLFFLAPEEVLKVSEIT